MLKAKIQALLFASGKPLSVRRLNKLTGEEEASVRAVLDEMKSELNQKDSGVHLLIQNDEVQLVTNPDQADVVERVEKEEFTDELTRPQLETLTIVSYRGAVTKPEIEQIRGVNCSLILRNLMIRGLVLETDDPKRLQPVYTVTPDFLRHLGLASIDELPDYGRFHNDHEITKLLEEATQPAAPESV